MRFPRLSHVLIAAAVSTAALLGVQTPAHADVNPVTRMEIVDFAKDMWDVPLSVLALTGSECTYFASSAWWAGGIEPTSDWEPKSTDPSQLASTRLNPGPTKAAASADHFVKYAASSGLATVREVAWSDNTAGGAELGDVIAYDWNDGADGVMDHVAVVTGFADGGYPTVTQHSAPRLDRGWSWDVDGENWIEYTMPGSKVYLVHLN